MKIFLTGKPGVGKSTVFLRIVEILRERGIKVGGFTTPEVREKGRRVGFVVRDLVSGREKMFASIRFEKGKRFGKYKLDVKAFEEIALEAMDFALKRCDVIAIDEIGKMEFLSESFKEKLGKILKSDRTLIAVLHRKFVKDFRDKGRIIEVTLENRERIPSEISSILFSKLNSLR